MVWGVKDADIDSKVEVVAKAVQEATKTESAKADVDFKPLFPCKVTLFPAPTR